MKVHRQINRWKMETCSLSPHANAGATKNTYMDTHLPEGMCAMSETVFQAFANTENQLNQGFCYIL